MAVKTRTETKMISKEWGKILTEPSKHPLKIRYRKEKDADWMYKGVGWKHGRKA